MVNFLLFAIAFSIFLFDGFALVYFTNKLESMKEKQKQDDKENEPKTEYKQNENPNIFDFVNDVLDGKRTLNTKRGKINEDEDQL